MENNTTSSIRRKNKKIILLIFIMFMTSTVLVVSTYAWFVGTGSVNTSSFTLDIGVADGLELSLDGEHWEDETLSISKTAIESGYTNHTNIWPVAGLFPISSNGVANTNGRLVLYQMGMITATNGGYRFTASQIDNSTTEKEGYIAFDLFVKNGTGNDYIKTYNELDDEAIYLTRNSGAVVVPVGSNTEDYGLANSVRIAFMHVGRVNSKTTQISTIIGINCTDSTYNTELCTHVTPIIWEPNNTRHNSNLISYFNSVCKQRTGETTYTSTPCASFTDYQDVNTFVVKQPIISSSRTDIYDGLNTYSNTTNLNNVATFTDNMKNSSGQTRSPFMHLAANSITKLRIYVYLEGQDVDNYDLISNGNKIAINFGFTKDIFSEEEEGD